MVNSYCYCFQAIWCRLTGIQPKGDEWDYETGDKIYDILDEYFRSNGLFAYFVSTDAEKKTNSVIDIQRHDIVLLDSENVNMNKLLVQKNLADIDPDTETAFDDIPSEEDWNECNEVSNVQNDTEDDSNDENDEDPFGMMDLCMDENGVQEFLNQMCQEQPQEVAPIQGTNNNKITVSESAKVSNDSDDNFNIPMNYRLIYKDQNSRRPEVYWQQCSDMVKLKIPASDKVEYNLEITSESIIYRYV